MTERSLAILLTRGYKKRWNLIQLDKDSRMLMEFTKPFVN